MDDTGALIDALGFPLNMGLRLVEAKSTSIAVPFTVMFLNGVCRGRIYTAPSGSMHYDAAWPPLTAGEQAKLFSTARSDEREARVNAIAQHFMHATADPVAVVISASDAENDPNALCLAAKTASTRFITKGMLTDVVRSISDNAATCILVEYRPPPSGHHHLVRCMYTPYATRVDQRQALAAINETDCALELRVATSGPDSERVPASRQLRIVVDNIFDAMGHQELLSGLGYAKGTCIQRAVLYGMHVLPRRFVVLWFSQLHLLEGNGTLVGIGPVPQPAHVISEKGLLDRLAHTSSDAVSAVPHTPPTSPLTENVALAEHIDLVTSVTDWGHYEGDLCRPSAALRKHATTHTVVSCVSNLPHYELPASWTMTDRFTRRGTDTPPVEPSSQRARHHARTPASPGGGNLTAVSAISHQPSDGDSVHSSAGSSAPDGASFHVGRIRDLRSRYNGDVSLVEDEAAARQHARAHKARVTTAASRLAVAASKSITRPRPVSTTPVPKLSSGNVNATALGSLRSGGGGGSSRVADARARRPSSAASSRASWDPTVSVAKPKARARPTSAIKALSEADKQKRFEERLMAPVEPIEGYQAQLRTGSMAGYIVGPLVDGNDDGLDALEPPALIDENIYRVDLDAVQADAQRFMAQAAKDGEAAALRRKIERIATSTRRRGSNSRSGGGMSISQAALNAKRKPYDTCDMTTWLFAESESSDEAPDEDALRLAEERAAQDEEMRRAHAVAQALEHQRHSIRAEEDRAHWALQTRVRSREEQEAVARVVEAVEELIYAADMAKRTRRSKPVDKDALEQLVIVVPPRLHALQREIKAALVGMGFTEGELDRDTAAAWQAHLTDMDAEDDTAGDSFDASRSFDNAASVRMSRNMSKSASALAQVPTAAPIAFDASTMSVEDNNGTLPSGVHGFFLRHTPVDLTRALSVLQQYEVDVAHVYTRGDNAQQQRLKHLVEAQGYTMFDAVCALKKGFARRASVAALSQSAAAVKYRMSVAEQTAGSSPSATPVPSRPGTASRSRPTA